MFAPPMSDSRSEPGTTGDNLSPPNGGPGPVTSAIFFTQHRLDAIMSDQDLIIAVVDGTLVQPGQVIDGCTLTRLEGTRAYFNCFDGEAVLDLQTRDHGSRG